MFIYIHICYCCYCSNLDIDGHKENSRKVQEFVFAKFPQAILK